MKKKFGLYALVLLTAAAVSSFGQDSEEGEEKDIVEFAAYIGKSTPTGGIKNYQDSLDAQSGFQFGFDAGYFVSPQFVAGIQFTYTKFGIDDAVNVDGLDHMTYYPGIYGKYLINTNSDFIPYLKGTIGLQNVKFTRYVENVAGNRYRAISYDPAFGYSLGAGLFWYSADYSGVFLEASYSASSTSDVKADYAGNEYVLGENVKSFDIRFGIRFVIGSGE